MLSPLITFPPHFLPPVQLCWRKLFFPARRVSGFFQVSIFFFSFLPLIREKGGKGGGRLNESVCVAAVHVCVCVCVNVKSGQIFFHIPAVWAKGFFFWFLFLFWGRRRRSGGGGEGKGGREGRERKKRDTAYIPKVRRTFSRFLVACDLIEKNKKNWPELQGRNTNFLPPLCMDRPPPLPPFLYLQSILPSHPFMAGGQSKKKKPAILPSAPTSAGKKGGREGFFFKNFYFIFRFHL